MSSVEFYLQLISCHYPQATLAWLLSPPLQKMHLSRLPIFPPHNWRCVVVSFYWMLPDLTYLISSIWHPCQTFSSLPFRAIFLVFFSPYWYFILYILCSVFHITPFKLGSTPDFSSGIWTLLCHQHKSHLSHPTLLPVSMCSFARVLFSLWSLGLRSSQIPSSLALTFIPCSMLLPCPVFLVCMFGSICWLLFKSCLSLYMVCDRYSLRICWINEQM